VCFFFRCIVIIVFAIYVMGVILIKLLLLDTTLDKGMSGRC
jgi:hypothetical protein